MNARRTRHVLFWKPLLCAALLCATLLAGCSGRDGDGGTTKDAGADSAPTDVATVDAGPADTFVAPPGACVALDLSQPLGATKLTEVLAAPGSAEVSRPTDLVVGADGRFVVASQEGRLFTARATDGQRPEDLALTLALDISDRVESRQACCWEEGLLSVALHPDYASNGQVFVVYSAKTPDKQYTDTHLSRFVAPDPASGVLDPDSETVLLAVPQPSYVHNGDKILFGPDDGYLYVALGDGGGNWDPEGNAQNKGTLPGSILRIDVDKQDPGLAYAIPPDNPFVDEPGSRGEIWAYGFRNPWRIAFDPWDGSLWAGDVGQGEYEEISRVEKGGNHGWKLVEGPKCHAGTEACEAQPLVPPVYSYDHSVGKSVTLGFFYRGNTFVSWYRDLLFGDFATGQIARLRRHPDGSVERVEVLDTGRQIATFGEGPDGEAYVLDWTEGKVLRLDRDGADGGGGPAWAATLSDTGCMTDPSARTLHPDMFAYSVGGRLWSDGAIKERAFLLPEGGAIDVLSGPDAVDPGRFDLPVGAHTIKTFVLGDRPIETRFMVRAESRWLGASYRWNEAGTDATLVGPAGLDETIDGQPWRYPSRAQCAQCHTRASGEVLGVRLGQLNRVGPYHDGVNQLAALEASGALSAPLAATPAELPAFADIADESADLADRARSYLHANCSPCHQPGGPTPTALDFRWSTPLAGMNACDVEPGRSELDIDGLKLIAPGAPAKSAVLLRMQSTDPAFMMPPLARHLVDNEGVALISAWISALDGCP